MQNLKTKIEGLIGESKYEEAAQLAAKELGVTLTFLGKEFKKHFHDDTNKRWVYECKLSKGENSYVFHFGSSTRESNTESNRFDMMPDDEIVEIYSGFSYREKLGFSASVKFKIKKEFLKNTPNSLLVEQAKLYQKNAEDNAKEHNKILAEQLKKRVIWQSIYDVNAVTLRGMNDEGSYIPLIQKAIQSKIEELKAERVFIDVPKEDAKEPTMYDVLTCLTKYDPGTFEDFCGDYGYDEDSRRAEKTYHAVVKEFEGMQRLFTSEELEILAEIN
jgi:hypothetical protein